MVITSKTQLREMVRIVPVASLAGVDILEQCKRFAMPDKVRGLTPVPFYNLSMKNLAWLWDVVDGDDMMKAVAEIFFYPSLPAWKRRHVHKQSDVWAAKWLLRCPVIDFYRYTYEIIEQVKAAAEAFSKMQVNLSKDEKAAGYGQPDPEAVHKMIDAFAQRQRISSLEEAADYAWVHYRFVFQNDVNEQNRQRKYNEIVAKKTKKK